MRNNNFLPKETVLRIIDSPITKEHMVDMIKGIPEVEAVEIKEGMTNGDMIKAMFPNVIIQESEDTVHLKYPTVNSDPLFFVQVSNRLWNAPI